MSCLRGVGFSPSPFFTLPPGPYYPSEARRAAFRNDDCRTCAAERLSMLVRTFDALHVYWIAVLPLGFWSRWHCTTCAS